MARALWLALTADRAGAIGIHLPLLTLPYFWDELGQFVPAALDILHDGALVPHSAVPNVHPPGVMAYLAGVWRVFGYSIPATRTAMLLLGSLTALFTFLLARRLLRGFPGAATLGLGPGSVCRGRSAVLHAIDDGAVGYARDAGRHGALWLFLEERHAWAALVCTALVLAKETGILAPCIFILVLWVRKRRLEAGFYLAPFVVLAAWLFLLWHTTGYIFGDPGFTHYNLTWAMNPARAGTSLVRHIFYLFVADFRWIGTIGPDRGA